MNYAVVVVTCNRVKLLEECVNAILAQIKPANQVIIVDNASKDGTEAYLASLDDRRFKVIRSSSNLGGAGGFALAMSEVDLEDNDFVLIIDDDAIIEKEFVSEIEKKMNADVLAYSGTVMEEGKPAVFTGKDNREEYTGRRRSGGRIRKRDFSLRYRKFLRSFRRHIDHQTGRFAEKRVLYLARRYGILPPFSPFNRNSECEPFGFDP